ncbi:hypothetical protein HK101_006252 [Irineochytrium annulatum]|nr:hypothetical protein HK101_006252 [Irineochytrium annulatum]
MGQHSAKSERSKVRPCEDDPPSTPPLDEPEIAHWQLGGAVSATTIATTTTAPARKATSRASTARKRRGHTASSKRQRQRKDKEDDSDVTLQTSVAISIVDESSPNSSESDTSVLRTEPAQTSSPGLQSILLRPSNDLESPPTRSDDRRVSIMVSADEFHSRPSVRRPSSANQPFPVASQERRRGSRLQVGPDTQVGPGSSSATIRSGSTRRTSHSQGGSSWGGFSSRRGSSLWGTTSTLKRTSSSATSERTGRKQNGQHRRQGKTRSIQFSIGSDHSLAGTKEGSQGQMSPGASVVSFEEDAGGVAGKRRQSYSTTVGSGSLRDNLSAAGSGGDISAIVEEEECKASMVIVPPLGSSLGSKDRVERNGGGDLLLGNSTGSQEFAERKAEGQHTPSARRRSSGTSYLTGATSREGTPPDGKTSGRGAEKLTAKERLKRRDRSGVVDSKDSISNTTTTTTTTTTATAAARLLSKRSKSTKTIASSAFGSQPLSPDGPSKLKARGRMTEDPAYAERRRQMMINNRKMSMELEEMKYASLIAGLPRVVSVWELDTIIPSQVQFPP